MGDLVEEMDMHAPDSAQVELEILLQNLLLKETMVEVGQIQFQIIFLEEVVDLVQLEQMVVVLVVMEVRVVLTVQ
jgi:hypothetical protein